MEREVIFRPAFDKRHKDPSKNYGIGAVTCYMILKDVENGKAVHFNFTTGMYLESVVKENYLAGRDMFHYTFAGSEGRQSYYMGYDVGYHDTKKHYKGQTKRKEVCDYIGKRCYSDGSALRAEEFMKVLVEKGSDEIWKMLEKDLKEL